MKRFILHRKSGWYARLRAFEILVDGERVGKLKQGEELSIEVPDTTEWLQVKVDWGLSQPINVTHFGDGQVFEIKGRFTLNPAKNIGATALPISIAPVRTGPQR